LGFANIWVAKTRSEADWVTFKVWIAVPLAMIFIVGIALYLVRGAFMKESKESAP